VNRGSKWWLMPAGGFLQLAHSNFWDGKFWAIPINIAFMAGALWLAKPKQRTGDR
jgi:hypothetical protein